MIEDLDQSWQRVELRHLAALRGVARAGSFRAAAERLGYSLSALSGQVASLERLVGQPLVERPGGRRPIAITPAGLRLLEHVDEIAARFVAARADLEAIRLERPELRLGIFQSAAVRLLPRIVGHLSRARPDLALELSERADDGVLLQQLAGGELDACFAVLPVGPGPFATAPVLDDPYVVLTRADGPLGACGSVAPGDLVDLPLIDFREVRPVHHGRQRLPRAARARIAARSDDSATIHALVAAGVGVAVLPELCIDTRDDALRAIPFDPPLAPRQVVLAWHRDRHPDGLDDVLGAVKDEGVLTEDDGRL